MSRVYWEHSEDFSGCPNCRPEFFDAFRQVIDLGYESHVVTGSEKLVLIETYVSGHGVV
jgi:7-cyano-7-deazaguanine synthase in queuosine biosynthesis